MRPLLPLAALVLACNSNADDTSPGETEDTEPLEVPDLALERVGNTWARPVLVTAPAGDDRLFVVEQTGRIKIVKDGSVLATPFLNASSLVTTGGNEQGLLGLAFHPSFDSNRKFYVNYTRPGGDTVVAEYQADAANPDVADTSTARTVLTVNQPYSNHNGGHLAFGPDGYLYIGLGDGGLYDDPAGNGQNAATLLGAMLRIDIDGSPFDVPPDNPFVGAPGRDEIWATGLRNPWRYSFDRTTGDLYIADVGQNQWEEVHVQPASSTGGENYGWDVIEGDHCFGGGSCDRSGLLAPVVEYPHADGCSVSGGYVYRGQAMPGLRGHYFYADYCRSWVRSFVWDGAAATDERDWTSQLTAGGNVLNGISSFGEDGAGELYITSLDNGRVYRIILAD